LPDQLPAVAAPVLEPLLDDPLAVDDAIAALRRYSLISPPASGVLSVHRLVQAVTVAQLPKSDAEAWQQAAAALITAALPGDPDQPANWLVYAALLAHAQTALDADSAPMTEMASYLGLSGGYIAARDLSRQILDALERKLGAGHSRALAARVSLARLTEQAGDAPSARDQYAGLLPVVEQTYGAEHPLTLAARANLARWTGEAGDAEGARDQYAALLPVIERVYGAEHPDTLTSRANFVQLTGTAGDAAGARDVLR
jgi:hypothetical protein